MEETLIPYYKDYIMEFGGLETCLGLFYLDSRNVEAKLNFFRQLFEKKENETLMCPIGLSGSFHDLFEVC